MYKNYLKTAFRNLWKNKLYSFINAFGLSIGIAFSGLIYLYVTDEYSFDRFHENSALIFRINEDRYLLKSLEEGGRSLIGKTKDNIWRSAHLPLPLSPTMKDELSEVQYTARWNQSMVLFEYGDKVFNEEVIYTDKDFFSMFSFELMEGDQNSLFNTRDEIVISESISRKYFGKQSGLNKTVDLTIGTETRPFKITGILEDPPPNSSLQFKILLPVKNKPYFEHQIDNWQSYNTPTFVQLYPNPDLDYFKTNLEGFTKKYFAKEIREWREREGIPEDEPSFALSFTNLNDIHLDTMVNWDNASDPRYSYILSAIALLIIIIACINYVALMLTSSARRKFEVGIRKVIGAQKGQLTGQFLVESILLALVSMVLSFVLIFFFLPHFNEFTGKNIMLENVDLLVPFIFVISLTVFIGLLSGSYPAFYLSNTKPILMLRSKFTSRLQAGFSKPLVVLQFALSAFMIISSLIMLKQMNYITTKDLGYDSDQVIVIPTHTGYSDEGEKVVDRFRNHFNDDPDILNVSGVSSSFNRGWSKYGYEINGERKSAFAYRVDPEYAPTLDIEIMKGRNFDPNIVSDREALLVNEALVKDMGYKEPLAERLNWREDSLGMPIIGVMKDYHYLSLEYKIEPAFLHINPDHGKISDMLIKIDKNEIPETISKIRQAWDELVTDKPFDYTFLDDDVARQYESYEKWSSIMGLSTIFAVIIACLGLFGLAGINAVNRTREIGIRKVFGASIGQIITMMNRQYQWLALIAFVIATPVSWYVMDQWLRSFEFAISIGWEIFVVAIIAGSMVALGTVSYHSIKTAFINPAETLKHE